jgi:hypothetical protein
LELPCCPAPSHTEIAALSKSKKPPTISSKNDDHDDNDDDDNNTNNFKYAAPITGSDVPTLHRTAHDNTLDRFTADLLLHDSHLQGARAA